MLPGNQAVCVKETGWIPFVSEWVSFFFRFTPHLQNLQNLRNSIYQVSQACTMLARPQSPLKTLVDKRNTGDGNRTYTSIPV